MGEHMMMRIVQSHSFKWNIEVQMEPICCESDCYIHTCPDRQLLAAVDSLAITAII